MFINLLNILLSKGIEQRGDNEATTKQAPNTTISLSDTDTMGQGNRFNCHLFEYDSNRLVGLYEHLLFFIIHKLLTVLLHTFHSIQQGPMMIQLKRLSRGLLPGTKTGILQDLQLEK